MLKKILIILIIVLIGVQFIRPSKNQTTEPQPNSADHLFPMSENLKTVMQKACLDCHSNNTQYPWYNNIQPVAFWMQLHVNKGKKKLNLDEFTNMPLRRQYHKLEEIAEEVKEGGMPLPSYTWTHKEAVLTEAEKNEIFAWTDSAKAVMERTYPKDSLIRKK